LISTNHALATKTIKSSLVTQHRSHISKAQVPHLVCPGLACRLGVVIHALPLLLELIAGSKGAAAACSACARATTVALLACLLLLCVVQDALPVHLCVKRGCCANLLT
jgi:hypothetical protein